MRQRPRRPAHKCRRCRRCRGEHNWRQRAEEHVVKRPDFVTVALDQGPACTRQAQQNASPVLGIGAFCQSSACTSLPLSVATKALDT